MTLQKDIAIYRLLVNKASGKYEYRVFLKGKLVKTRKTDREYNYGAVYISTDGTKVTMDSMRKNAGQFDRYTLEDTNTFIIPVTIQS